MAGIKGRSGGWNKKTTAEHLAAGTFRADRHRAPRALAAVAVPIRAAIPEGVTAGLQAPGLAFVEACWAGYTGWGPSSLTLLREAAVTLDELEALRGTRGERAAQRVLLATLAALRLED
jgi:hypothetical protein